MPVDDPIKLFTLSCELLAAAEACLNDNGIALPVSRYVSPCPPDQFCCSNLVVRQGEIEMQEIEDSRGVGASKGCLVRRVIHFDLWIERCVVVVEDDGGDPPIGSCAVPAPGTVSGDALAVLTERWVILQCLLGSLRALGHESAWCCQPLSIVAVEPICEGLCAGTRFEITLTI